MKEQRLLGKKIYRVWQITWILPMVFSALIVFLLSACVFLTIRIITTHNTSAIVPLLSLFILTCFFAYVTLLFFDIPAARLELLDEGVLFYGSGYHLYTPWNNISSIIWTTRAPRFPSVFELKEPAVTTLSLDEGRLNNQAILETHWQLPAWLLQNNKEVFVLDVNCFPSFPFAVRSIASSAFSGDTGAIFLKTSIPKALKLLVASPIQPSRRQLFICYLSSTQR